MFVQRRNTMLNQSNINLVESIIATQDEAKFISNQNPRCPSISYRYYDNAVYLYNLVKNSDVNSYEIFASNGMGHQSFGMYKANNEKMYIIEAYVESLSYVYEIGDKLADMLPV